MEQRHVLAHLGRLADDDAHPVIDEEARAENGRRVDLDAREKASDVRQEAGGDPEAATPEPVRRTERLP